MTRLVDHDGKPFRPSEMSLITRETLAIMDRMLASNEQAERDLALALSLDALRRSCGVADGQLGANVTIRRPARFTPKEIP